MTSLASRQNWAIVGIACALVLATRVEAASHVGWVWANQPNATSTYAPESLNSYNSSGGQISITPVGTGLYIVDFAGLYNAQHLNNVQVVATDTNGYCTADGWDAEGAGRGAEMEVACFDASGNPANEFFSLEYQQRTSAFGSATKGIAFLLANQPTSTSYTPNASYNFNSTGAANTITRNAPGTYMVIIPGLSGVHSDIQVTAYGGSAARCALTDWGPNASGGAQTFVFCLDGSGNRSDTEFSLAYAVDEPFGLTSSATANGAWAYTNRDGATKPYKPEKDYQYNGFGTGALTAVANSTGNYTVTIPGSLSFSHSHVLVTSSYGTTGAYCNVLDWGGQTINVGCYSQGGAPVTTQFFVAFQTED